MNFSPGNSFAGGSDISKWPAMCTPQDYKGCDALDDRPFSNLMSASFGNQPSAFDERIHVRNTSRIFLPKRCIRRCLSRALKNPGNIL